jgi:hypothetical protein
METNADAWSAARIHLANPISLLPSPTTPYGQALTSWTITNDRRPHDAWRAAQVLLGALTAFLFVTDSDEIGLDHFPHQRVKRRLVPPAEFRLGLTGVAK